VPKSPVATKPASPVLIGKTERSATSSWADDLIAEAKALKDSDKSPDSEKPEHKEHMRNAAIFGDEEELELELNEMRSPELRQRRAKNTKQIVATEVQTSGAEKDVESDNDRKRRHDLKMEGIQSRISQLDATRESECKTMDVSSAQRKERREALMQRMNECGLLEDNALNEIQQLTAVEFDMPDKSVVVEAVNNSEPKRRQCMCAVM